MKNLESITKEVAPSFTAPLPVEKKLEVKALLNILDSTLSVDKRDLLASGIASRGWKDLSILKVLRECLFLEIEDLQVSKNTEDANVRLATNQIKRNLKSQVDTIINILESSTNKKENFYYLIGVVLASLEKMEQ